MKTKVLLYTFLILGVAYVQETSSQTATKAVTKPLVTTPVVRPEVSLPRLDDTQSVFLIVCDTSPDKIIVLNKEGKWLSEVKTVTLKFDLGKPPTMTCTMWAGAFKPTTPGVKIWALSQKKSVTAVEFQQMVDSLQKDDDAIKKLTGGK